nr:hypothetical protein [Ktedonobacter racemifer]
MHMQAWWRNETIDIKRNGSHPSGKGPADYFTGTVRIDSPFEAPDPARVGGASARSSLALGPHGIVIRSARR